MEKLKPCPFCGSLNVDYGYCYIKSEKHDYVTCMNCGAEIRTLSTNYSVALNQFNNPSIADNSAVKQWNKRVYKVKARQKKKPKIHEKYYSGGCYIDTEYSCPECNFNLRDYKDIYCPNCGQPIDWRKNDKT